MVYYQGDGIHFLDFDLDDVSCTPELRSGDLLVARADTIHRTQPHRSWRTSLNIKVRQKQRCVDLGHLLQGGVTKYTYLSRDPTWAHRAADSAGATLASVGVPATLVDALA